MTQTGRSKTNYFHWFVQEFRCLENKRKWWLFVSALFLFFFLASHQDVKSTAYHSYILLEDIFQGNVLDFYNHSLRHANVLFPYQDVAIYNIVIYFFFAIFQLPVFVFYKLTGLTEHYNVIAFTGKFTSIVFYLGCIILVYCIARFLGLSRSKSDLAAFSYALFPVSFFTVAITGHYDTIELFFILLAICFWLQGNLTAFSFWMGVAIPCKLFAVFVFAPLLLLKEKRFLHLIKNICISLWLILPTNLLFLGRKSSIADIQATFSKEMVARFFSTSIPGHVSIALFPLSLVVLCFVAFLLSGPADTINRQGLWFALAALGLFNINVFWHPQWIGLLIPFLVLTTHLCTNSQKAWGWLDWVLSFSFFFLVVFHWHNAFTYGSLVSGYPLQWLLRFQPTNNFAFVNVLENSVFISQIGRPIFNATLLLHVVLKIPLPKQLLADRLTGETFVSQLNAKHVMGLWGAFVGLWLLISVTEALVAFHVF